MKLLGEKLLPIPDFKRRKDRAGNIDLATRLASRQASRTGWDSELVRCLNAVSVVPIEQVVESNRQRLDITIVDGDYVAIGEDGTSRHCKVLVV
jgi:hypothetical protein